MHELKAGVSITFTELADLENEIAALCVQVPAEAEQHEAELAQALERFERRLVALERHSRSASTTVDIQPRLTFNRGHEE
jgi:hypothetical protein